MMTTQESWIFILLTLAYLAARTFAERRFARRRSISDEECLSCLSMVRECSAYDIFRSAAEIWNFSRTKVDGDFSSYLRKGRIPHYVARFSRDNVSPEDLRLHAVISMRG
jgi:hypothetical protein